MGILSYFLLLAMFMNWVSGDCYLYILDYYRRVIQKCRSRRGHDRMVVGLTATCTITNQWVSPLKLRLNHADSEMYSIQHYVIEFVSDLRQVFCFLQVLLFPLQIKLTATYLTEILLKVALNTITLILTLQKCIYIYTPTVIIIQKW